MALTASQRLDLIKIGALVRSLKPLIPELLEADALWAKINPTTGTEQIQTADIQADEALAGIGLTVQDLADIHYLFGSLINGIKADMNQFIVVERI